MVGFGVFRLVPTRTVNDNERCFARVFGVPILGGWYDHMVEERCLGVGVVGMVGDLPLGVVGVVGGGGVVQGRWWTGGDSGGGGGWGGEEGGVGAGGWVGGVGVIGVVHWGSVGRKGREGMERQTNEGPN